MKRIKLHQTNPSLRNIKQIAEEINNGSTVIFPTDTLYGLGCLMTNKGGIEQILRLTGKKAKAAKLSLICKDLKTVAEYTQPYGNHIFKTC